MQKLKLSFQDEKNLLTKKIVTYKFSTIKTILCIIIAGVCLKSKTKWPDF